MTDTPPPTFVDRLIGNIERLYVLDGRPEETPHGPSLIDGTALHDMLDRFHALFVNAQVSFKRIATLSADFANPEPHLSEDVLPPAMLPKVETIELRGARYTFPAVEGVEPFTLGPIDLSVRGGEILFVVGENGCGKTTLIKLLLGLYQPQHGELLLNGEPVTSETRDDYRQLFSAVFFDYFLFDDIGAPDEDASERATGYLDRLEIAHKVTVSEGKFSTTDLSAGQRKRLLANAERTTLGDVLRLFGARRRIIENERLNDPLAAIVKVAEAQATEAYESITIADLAADRVSERLACFECSIRLGAFRGRASPERRAGRVVPPSRMAFPAVQRLGA